MKHPILIFLFLLIVAFAGAQTYWTGPYKQYISTYNAMAEATAYCPTPHLRRGFPSDESPLSLYTWRPIPILRNIPALAEAPKPAIASLS
jgi:hypothetical protein